MLKYQLHKDRIQTDYYTVKVDDFYPIETNSDFDWQTRYVIVTPDIDKIEVGQSIIITWTGYTTNDYLTKLSGHDDIGETEKKYLSRAVKVDSVNADDKSFSVLLDKYFRLDILTISPNTVITEYDTEGNREEIEYIYFYFKDNHYFNGVLGENFGNISLFFIDGNGAWIEIPQLEYVNKSILRIKQTDYQGNIDTDIQFWNNGIYRSQIFFGDVDTTSIEIDYISNVINIPFSQEFSNNLIQSELVNDIYSDTVKTRAINGVNDYEKDVYYPVIKQGNAYSEVKNIVINLHFRQRDKNWKILTDGVWNGMKMTKDSNGNITSVKVEDNYFDKAYKTHKERQSDLLGYVNFTDNDISYQKSKLKKSFVRLSFYDSTNPARQNLLYYNTIFIDSGKLFSKYTAHVETEGFSYLTDDGALTEGLMGLKCNREPNNIDGVDLTEDNVEKYRLSSQFVVSDKYHTDKSSAGYYLYLWKDNDSGLIPQDLYMKVEFNHAGTGQTTPFSLPHDKAEFNADGSVKKGGDIYSFDDMVSKYEDIGFQQYLRHSYIHLKYRFDKENGRHIYYIDSDYYNNFANQMTDENDNLILNLYEARISQEKD